MLFKPSLLGITLLALVGCGHLPQPAGEPLVTLAYEPAWFDKSWTIVVKIDGSVNDVTRTFGVYISIPNEDLRLIPGITGYARILNQHMGLAVPSTAVIDPVGDKATVFVIGEDGRSHIRTVRRGLMADGLTELLDGVQEGEQVVTSGQQELHDNDRVSVNHSGPWNQ